MDRREFIAAGAALAAATGTAGVEAHAAGAESGREIYDLRTYTFESKDKLDRYAAFLSEAWLPATKRNGMAPAGAFVSADKPESLFIVVIASFPSIAAWNGFETRLAADQEYLKAGASVLDLPATDPPYTHVESSVLGAFHSWPHIKAPKQAAANEAHVFELRTYESHSKKANLKKIEMFDKGETDIFARAGFQPVFFSEALSGPQIPNLTYMVTYPTVESRDGFWKAFMADPEKARLFSIPEYSDKLIVSKIHSTFLKPLPGSAL